MSPQHMEALKIAHSRRIEQYAVSRELRALSPREGAQRAAERLREPDEAVGSMLLDRFLSAIPRYGDDRIRQLMQRVGMPPGHLLRRVRELSERERRVLADAIEQRAREGQRR